MKNSLFSSDKNNNSSTDITELKQLKDLLLIQRDVVLEMGKARCLNETLSSLLNKILEIKAIDSGGIYILDNETGNLELVAHKGLSPKFVEQSTHYEKDDPHTQLVMRGKTVYEAYSNLPIDTTKKKYEELKSIAIIPIVLHDEVIAVMNLASQTHEVIPTNSRIALETIASAVGNIIENAKMNDRIKKQKDDLVSFYNNLHDFVFILDQDGNIVATNKAARKKLGYTKEELESMHVLKMHPPERRKEAAYIVEEMAKGKRDLCLIPLFTNDGTYIPVETKITYGTWDGKTVIFGVSRDISEHEEAEEAILKAKLAAEEASHTKTEFLANMSHELRTPLNSIIGYSQLLSEFNSEELNGKQQKYACNILKSGRHLLALINDILDISKIETGKMELINEKVNLSDLLEDTKVVVLPMAAQKKIDLKLDVEPENLEVYADWTKLKEIIYNLLSNAIKYTPEGGNICLASRYVDDKLHFTITDNGIGIDADMHEKIFEPFKQVGSFSNRQHKGTGLGLALVKQYVEMHGGNISVESEVDKGSTFTFTIPNQMPSE